MSILRFLIFSILIFFNSCQNNKKIKQLNDIKGYAQGSTYSIRIYDYPINTDSLKLKIDSILDGFDNSLSTYKNNSLISNFNLKNDTVRLDNYFYNVLDLSLQIAEKTDGLFDFTVAPIVNAWGFGFKNIENVDSLTIDSLLSLVSYKNIVFNRTDSLIIKNKKEIMIDFNAIAQGYSVDVVKDFLIANNLKNFMIEIGGELITQGKKKDDENWKIGIDKPSEDGNLERQLNAIINLKNKALATSGNYRKYYEKDGIKLSHTINPKTGYPVKHSLLSATVIANDCGTADAYATAFMVMGEKKSLDFLEKNTDLNLLVYFISAGENDEFETYISPKLKEIIEEL